MNIKTDNYLLKNIVSFLFNEKTYHKIKLYKIIFDFKIGKSYENIEEMLPSLLSNSSVVLDIGANMGQFACRLNKYLRKGSVYSIEPFSVNYRALIEMKRILKLNNLKTFRIAMSDKNSFLNLKIPIKKNKLVIGTQAVLESYEREKFDDVTYRIEKVASMTLDKFISEEKIEKIDLIKIDTEGAEISVLKGGIECLKKYKPILIVEINPNNKDLLFLFNLGYEAYVYINKNIVKYNNAKVNGNTIFLHTEKSNMITNRGIK